MEMATGVSAPDSHRAKAYSAEDQFSNLMNRGGIIEFFDSKLDIPAQKRFANLDSIVTYVQILFTQLNLDLRPPQVRERKGCAKAHYELSGQVIAIPVSGEAARWALRETVILHECAHHVASKFASAGEPVHGPTFTASMLLLVQTAFGDQARLLLSAGYLELGVPVGNHQKIFSPGGTI
jgi:putative metallohydrolase (TIGR04338 family)